MGLFFVIFGQMINDEIRKKLQNIIRGNGSEGQGDSCTAIRNILLESFGTGRTVKSEFQSRAVIKEKQAFFLKSYAEKESLWMQSLPSGCDYLTRGGESEVYLSANKRNVVKVNDAIYYATWMEYFNSLVIHNLLFPSTAYSFLGFMDVKNDLCAVLLQPFIEGEQADLADITELLTFNGFVNTRRQDYYNKEFGLLLEDMHDENVIYRQELLFFIDTVFYIV